MLRQSTDAVQSRFAETLTLTLTLISANREDTTDAYARPLGC